LRLRDRSKVASLTKRRGVGAQKSEPDIFRAFLLDAVFFPFHRAAAAAVMLAQFAGL